MRDLRLADLRSCLAWAPQQAEVFEGSLRDNLRLAGAEMDDAGLLALLGELGLDTLLGRLPGGLDGWVGEYGAALSAGERARLSVARALLRPGATLLLLDEPTAHLDLVNVRRLLRAVEARTPDRTVVLVTHQPSLLGPGWRVVGLDGVEETSRSGDTLR